MIIWQLFYQNVLPNAGGMLVHCWWPVERTAAQE